MHVFTCLSSLCPAYLLFFCKCFAHILDSSRVIIYTHTLEFCCVRILSSRCFLLQLTQGLHESKTLWISHFKPSFSRCCFLTKYKQYNLIIIKVYKDSSAMLLRCFVLSVTFLTTLNPSFYSDNILVNSQILDINSPDLLLRKPWLLVRQSVTLTTIKSRKNATTTIITEKIKTKP